MVVERVYDSNHSEEESRSLEQLVRGNPVLQRTLFWADVKEERTNSRRKEKPTFYWQIGLINNRLWELGRGDLPWLYEDLSRRRAQHHKRIALSAITAILHRTGKTKTEGSRLRKAVAGNPVLAEDLALQVIARRKSAKARASERDRQRRLDQRDRDRETAKESWLDFSQKLRDDPGQLRDSKRLRSWKAGAFRLKHLTDWLQGRTKADDEHAAREWRLLEEGFGRKVAEAYRDGMKTLWRTTPSQRPTRTEGGATTSTWMAILSLSGIEIEAAEDRDWTARLTKKEAVRAAQHGCWGEQRFPEWLGDLILSHATEVLPVLKDSLLLEWLFRRNGPTDLLSHYATQTFPIPPPVQQILLEIITGREPRALSMLDRGLRIARNLKLDQQQKRRVISLARRRLTRHTRKGNGDYALRYLALLFLMDTERAADDLVFWIELDRKGRKERAERSFGLLFDRHDPLITGILDNMSVRTLERMVLLAYTHIRPEDDVIHERMYTPGARDNAEDARNKILGALLDRPGADAFRAMQRASEHPALRSREIRFRELAHGKAERDSDTPAWKEAEVVAFERQKTAPVKTGGDLLRIVSAVIQDIQHDLTRGDVTSRPLLKRAESEDELQHWIVEQMNFRSRGRFHAHREAQVAKGDKPDVIVSSTAADCQVALEVKHGGMGWTPRQLEDALRNQLAENYLKVSTRRHGIMLISHHGRRQWRDPETGKMLPFNSLVERLCSTARTLIENENGDPIEVRCFGLDTSGPAPAELNGGSKSAKKPGTAYEAAAAGQ